MGWFIWSKAVAEVIFTTLRFLTSSGRKKEKEIPETSLNTFSLSMSPILCQLAVCTLATKLVSTDKCSLNWFYGKVSPYLGEGSPVHFVHLLEPCPGIAAAVRSRMGPLPPLVGCVKPAVLRGPGRRRATATLPRGSDGATLVLERVLRLVPRGATLSPHSMPWAMRSRSRGVRWGIQTPRWAP